MAEQKQHRRRRHLGEKKRGEGGDSDDLADDLTFLTRFLREEKCDDHYSQTLSNRRCSMIIITVSIVGTV